MRFVLYDTLSNARDVTADVSLSEMRNLLSEFKTHCVVGGSSYQFNHFVNWAKKHYGVNINRYANEPVERVDM
jgi:hypothetical protein